MRKLYILGLIALVATIIGLAWAEEVTITTYYPAPYGVYNEMRAKRMAIGDTYYDASQYYWEDTFPNIDSEADLIVEGNIGIGTTSPSYKLDVNSDAIRLGTTQTGNVSLYIGADTTHRYLQLLNAGAASGLKVGGLLVSDTYAYANPGRNDLIVKGNVGIGTPIPGEKLDVAGWIQSKSSAGVLKLAETDNSNVWWLVADANYFSIRKNNTGTYPLTIRDSGNVGIGTTSPGYLLHLYKNASAYPLYIGNTNGYAYFGCGNTSYFHHFTDRGNYYWNKPCYAVGGFHTYSSRDVKQDISYLSPQEERAILETFKSLKIATFRYIGKDVDKKTHLGLIVEEAPEQIVSDDKAISLLDYTSYAITAIKAQQRQIEDLGKRIETLEAKLNIGQ